MVDALYEHVLYFAARAASADSSGGDLHSKAVCEASWDGLFALVDQPAHKGWSGEHSSMRVNHTVAPAPLAGKT